MAEAYGLTPPTGPFLAELDVTYRCDARYQMCERWKDQRRDELTLDDYDDLAETFQRARREIARARTCRCWYNNTAFIVKTHRV